MGTLVGLDDAAQHVYALLGTKVDDATLLEPQPEVANDGAVVDERQGS